MPANLTEDLPIAVEIAGARMQTAQLVSLVQARKFSVVCLADLPPSPPSKTRYLVKRLRAALPDTRIVVARWGPVVLADGNTAILRDAGATRVDSRLIETRDYLARLLETPRVGVPDSTAVHAA